MDDDAWPKASQGLREALLSEPGFMEVTSDVFDVWYACSLCNAHYRKVEGEGHDPDECIVSQVLES